jgi:hypothetical protein
MRLLLIAICILGMLSTSWAETSQTHCQIAQQAVTNSYKYKNLREKTNHNDGPQIDEFHRYVGLDNQKQIKATGSGYSWCAAFVVYNYKEAAEFCGKAQPLPKTAGVANLWNRAKENPVRYTTFTVEQVRLGLIKLQPGDMPIWKHGTAKQAFTTGHIGLTISQVSNTKLKTIEGNTSPGEGGSQSDGGGVYFRDRYLSPSNFYILGFVRIKE